MICLISFMFIMSTFVWLARLENDIAVMVDLSNGTFKAKNRARLMSSALSLLNVSIHCYDWNIKPIHCPQVVISDGVVVWRAWALARESRWALRACLVCFGLTFGVCSISLIRAKRFDNLLLVTALQDIVIRTILLYRPEPRLSSLINVTQGVNIGLSLLTNIIATLIISLKAW